MLYGFGVGSENCAITNIDTEKFKWDHISFSIQSLSQVFYLPELFLLHPARLDCC